MTQHYEQESRETLTKPRFIHEDLLHLGTLTRALQAAGHAPDEILRTILAKIDGLEREWRTKLDASLNALADAVNDKGGWVGELTTGQWEQIAGGLRAVYRPHMGQVPTPDELVEQLKAHLEQQNGGSPRMSGQYKPSLGDWVHFSHFHEKPTRDEVTARGEDTEEGEATIAYMRRENPAPDWVTALVVGVQSVEAATPLGYNDAEGTWFVSWGHQQGAPHRTFYVVKYTLRGRRYLVALEDIRQQNGGSPS